MDRATQGSNPKIEITSQMVQAGLRTLNESGLLGYETDSNSLIVRDVIFNALRAGGVFCKIQSGEWLD